MSCVLSCDVVKVYNLSSLNQIKYLFRIHGLVILKSVHLFYCHILVRIHNNLYLLLKICQKSFLFLSGEIAKHSEYMKSCHLELWTGIHIKHIRRLLILKKKRKRERERQDNRCCMITSKENLLLFHKIGWTSEAEYDHLFQRKWCIFHSEY